MKDVSKLRDLTEPELLRRVKAGDEPAFEELVARHTGLALSIATRVLRNRAEAEEVAQEAFLRIFRKIGSFDLSRPFVPWLFRITLNLSYTRLKKSRSHQALSVNELQPRFDDMGMQVPDELTTVVDLEERLATREAAERAEEIIAELPEEYGTVLWMHDVAGISASTLTEVLELSLPALKSRLHRGRLAVRKRLLESLTPDRTGVPPPRPPMPMAMGAPMGITCRDVVESLLIDYLEDRLNPSDREQFERHLRGCDRCGPFVESYRRLVSSLSGLPEPAIPAEMVETTLSFVRTSLESGRYLDRNWAEGLRAVFGRPLRRLFRRRP